MAETTVRLEIVAPEQIFYEGEASFLELNTTEGEVGIYPDHIPMTMIVAPGELRIHNGKEVRQADLISGFMEIQKGKITILAEEISWK